MAAIPFVFLLMSVGVLPPNIVFFLTDDQDQVLGASFPPTAENVTPMPRVKELMVDGGVMVRDLLIC